MVHPLKLVTPNDSLRDAVHSFLGKVEDEKNEHTHLLVDLNKELAWAGRELEKAIEALAEIETSFNAMHFHDGKALKDTSLLERDRTEAELHVDELMDVYGSARKHFEETERLYELARGYIFSSVLAVNLRRALLPSQPELRAASDVRHSANRLAKALHTYCTESPSDAADRDIREALRDFQCNVERHILEGFKEDAKATH